MIINHNIAALNTYRQLSTNNTMGNKSLEKLSSGLRINRAGDDAAGLAISEKMRAQVRGLDQATRNAQDGISLIQTAEGALNETHSILQRMRELANQAANDTNVAVDRNEIQKEINQLTSEINRIGNTTEFNTQELLKGGTATGEITVSTTQAGVAPGGTVPAVAASIEIQGLTFTAKTAGVAGNNIDIVFADPGGNDKALGVVVAGNTITVNLATDSGGAIKSTADDIKALLNGEADVMALLSPVTGSGSTAVTAVTSTNLANGADAVIDAVGTKGTATITIDTNFAAGDRIEINGKSYTAVAADAKAGEFAIGADETATATNLLAAIKAADNTIDATSAAAGAVITLVQATATDAANPFVAEAKADYQATLQIGANTGQSMTIQVNDMRSLALKVSGNQSEGSVIAKNGSVASYVATQNVTNGTNNDSVEFALDVSTHEKATAAISVINDAIENVSAERSKLGAFQNRLEHTINNLGTSAENLTAAESRIRDVDMAKEMMEFTKMNILSQAAQAMLAQANQQPQGVLQLLR